MEVLESYGVPVFAFGQDEIPAFWSRSSGLLAPLSTDDPALIAKSARVRDELGLAGGQLVTNPIPKDAEIPARELEPIIDEAIKTASNQGIVGKAVTPFLLGKILDLTQGRSLVANIALIRNNARLAARIAVEFGNKG